ncbi:YraN family protein [Sediminicola arcticus]|jgi:putative endonuclease|uniref:YraN family protein n=1 Tax=Sediminicola arcticus TaxID=1574308 RepID=A0ABV2SVM8_9FLAO|tara:strand:- start:59 stop:283 length:225 start_codon:yes stop_codon:yes gene_type:complete
MGKHNEFGKLGEQIATDYLIEQGYTITYRNYRYLKAEIDIVALKGIDLAVIEVKSRSTILLVTLQKPLRLKRNS